METTKIISIKEMCTLAKTEEDTETLWKILKDCEYDNSILINMAENPNIIKDSGLMSEICRRGNFLVRDKVEDILKKNK